MTKKKSQKGLVFIPVNVGKLHLKLHLQQYQRQRLKHSKIKFGHKDSFLCFPFAHRFLAQPKYIITTHYPMLSALFVHQPIP